MYSYSLTFFVPLSTKRRSKNSSVRVEPSSSSVLSISCCILTKKENGFLLSTTMETRNLCLLLLLVFSAHRSYAQDACILPSNYQEIRLIFNAEQMLANEFKAETSLQFNGTPATKQVMALVGEYNVTGVRLFIGARNDGSQIKVEGFTRNATCLIVQLEETLKSNETYLLALDTVLDPLSDRTSMERYSDITGAQYVVTTMGDFLPSDIFPSPNDLKQRPKFTLWIYADPALQEFCVLKNIVVLPPNVTVSNLTNKYVITNPIPTSLMNFFIGNTVEVYLRNDEEPYLLTLNARQAISSKYPELFRLMIQCIKDTFFNIKSYLEYGDFDTIHIDSILLPELSPHLMDTIGVMYFPEEMLTDFDYDRDLQTIIGEKVARQYFMGVVFPSNTTDLWISHGMSKYFGYMNRYHGGYVWMTAESLMTALRDDAWHLEHDVAANLDTFSLTGNKAAALFRLLAEELPQGAFQNFIKQFVAQYKFKPVTADQFITLLNQTANTKAPFCDYLTSFMGTKGYPVLHITAFTNQNTLTVTQEAFTYQYARNKNDTSSDDSYLWTIPIKANDNQTFWMATKTQTLVSEKGKQLDILNFNWTGYYRVNYQDNWLDMIGNMNDPGVRNRIEPANRAQLIDDSLALARAGYINFSVPLRIMESLKLEMDVLPWEAAYEALKYLYNLLNGPYKVDGNNLNLLKPWIDDKVKGHIKELEIRRQLNIDDENSTLIYGPRGQDILQDLSCMVGSEWCEKKAAEAFLKQPDDMDPTVSNAIGCRVARKVESMQTMYDYLRQTTYQTDNNHRRFYFRVFACTQDIETLTLLVAEALSLHSPISNSTYEKQTFLKNVAEYSDYWTFWSVADFVRTLYRDREEIVDKYQLRQFLIVAVKRVHDVHTDDVVADLVATTASDRSQNFTSILEDYLYTNKRMRYVNVEQVVKYLTAKANKEATECIQQCKNRFHIPGYNVERESPIRKQRQDNDKMEERPDLDKMYEEIMAKMQNTRKNGKKYKANIHFHDEF